MMWYGADGVTPMSTVAQVRPVAINIVLRDLGLSDAFWWSVLWAHILLSLSVIFGFYTRTSMVLLYLSRLLLFHRNPFMPHQVDIFMRIYGFPLMFAPAGEMYSVDAWKKSQADPSWRPRHLAPWAQRMIQLQLTCIYAEAFLGKIVSKTWLSGDAVYYATHFYDGLRNTVPPWLDHLWVYEFMTYFTLGIEFSLCVLIWIPRLRYSVLVGGVLFHLGIHWLIHLDLLEFAAMFPFLCFVRPQDMERWIGAIRSRLPGRGDALT